MDPYNPQQLEAEAQRCETEEEGEELLALDQALERLAEVSPRAGQVLECRFFAGLTTEETAEVLGVSHMTVSRDWRLAKAWILRELDAEPDG